MDRSKDRRSRLPGAARLREWAVLFGLDRRRVRLLAGVAAVALLAAVYSCYHVSVSPPALHQREVQFSVAQAEVTVDTTSSALVDQRENQYLLGPGIQAQFYTLLLETDAFRLSIAQAAGLHGQLISASGPFTLWNLTQLNGYVGTPVSSPLPVNGDYRLLVDVDGVDPMVTLYGQAPTTRAALAIVLRARTLLERWVADHTNPTLTPTLFRATIRSLGAPTSGVVDPGVQPEVMGFVFAVVMIFGGALVLAIDRRRRLGRRPAPTPEQVRIAAAAETAPMEDMWPHTRRLLPWSLAVFVGAIFLVPFESITLPMSLPFGSTADRVLLIGIAGLWVLALAVIEGPARPRVRLTRVHLLALAFFALCCLGIGLNGHELAINQEVVPTLKKLGIVFSLVIFLFIAASVLRPREVSSFLTMILWLGVFVGLASIVEAREHFDVFYSLWAKLAGAVPPAGLDQPDSIGRLSVEGPTIQPLELASLLAMVLPIALVKAMDAETSRRRMKYLLAAAVIVGGGLATSRKTSVVDPLVAVLVLTAYRPRLMIKGMIASALPLFVIVHLAAPGQIGSVISELLPGHINTVATTTDRTVRYDAVRPDIMSHFLIGRGFESYDPYKYRILDNEFLGLLIGVGVIGLLIYLCIFGTLMGFSHRMIRGPSPKRSSSALIMLSMLTVALVSHALFDVLSFSHVSYLFFFIAAMVIALRGGEDTSRPEDPLRLSDEDWPVLSYEPGPPEAQPRDLPLPVA